MHHRSHADTSAAVAAGQGHIAAVSAITGGVLGLASVILLGAAFGLRAGDAAPDLTTVPASRAGLIRWGALTDMLGFYLLGVPMTLHLGHRFDADRDELMAVATAAGLLYAAIDDRNRPRPRQFESGERASESLRRGLEGIESGDLVSLWRCSDRGRWRLGVGDHDGRLTY